MVDEKLINYVNDVFDKLHAIPEIAFEEYKTSAFIANELKAFGYEVTEKVNGPEGTGVIGVLDSGKPGLVFALRADMDALEFEKNGEKYCVHACGHDAHSSMVLAAAKKIAETGIKSGKFYVVFQPAEERLYGATSMIESGKLNEIQEMVGIHLRPIQEAKLGQATPALVHGASNRVDIVITGLNSHGARPHLGVNAAEAAVAITNAINSIKANPSVSHSMKVTSIKVGGDTFNLIPDKGTLTLDVRAQNNEVMEDMLNKLKLAVEFGAKSVGAEAKIDFVGGVPAAEYSDELIQLARESITDVLGSSLDILVTPGGEDFHFYSKNLNIKTGYVGLGADLTPGLHHPEMTFDKAALEKGVSILVDMTLKKLG